MTPEEVRAQAKHVTALFHEGKIPEDAGVALLKALEAGARAMEDYEAAREGRDLAEQLRTMPRPSEERPAVVSVSRTLRDRVGHPMVSLAVGSRSLDVCFGPEDTIPTPEQYLPPSD